MVWSSNVAQHDIFFLSLVKLTLQSKNYLSIKLLAAIIQPYNKKQCFIIFSSIFPKNQMNVQNNFEGVKVGKPPLIEVVVFDQWSWIVREGKRDDQKLAAIVGWINEWERERDH